VLVLPSFFTAGANMVPRMKPTERQPPALNGNVTHGDTLLKQAVSKLGKKALDGRTTLAKELETERRELISALGGLSEVSPQEMAIVEMIAMKRVRRKPIQQWALLNRGRLFDRRKRSLVPIALQLEQLEESEVRLLKELGLKRRAKQLPSLTEYLNGNGKKAMELSTAHSSPTAVTAQVHAPDGSEPGQDAKEGEA
jgi:hypothetical protein